MFALKNNTILALLRIATQPERGVKVRQQLSMPLAICCKTALVCSLQLHMKLMPHAA
jgi:hypothetical protein